MIKEFNPNDSLTINACASTSADDLQVVTLLYGPLIKADALCLYLSLSSILNRNNLQANYTHQELLGLLGFDATRFYLARVKLEAIGLLSTYQKEDEYLLLLKTPLSAKQFLSDGVLGMYLYSAIGDSQFKKLQSLFQLPKVDKNVYQEITASFDDVFESVNEVEIKNEGYILDKKVNSGVKIKNYAFDFELFKSGISETFLEGKRVTERFKKFIINMAYAYMFNEKEMQEIYNKSLNKSGSFDYLLFSKRSREKYQELNDISMPKLKEKEEVKQAADEELLASLPAKALIESVTGKKSVEADVTKIADLYVEFGETLPRSVINACVLYSVKRCDGEVPAIKYFETVLKDWLVKGIVTFEEAKKEINKESSKGAKKGQKKSNNPDWLKEYVKNFEEGVEDL